MIARSALPRLWLALTVLGIAPGLAGCHSDIRFDDHSIDAAGPGPAPPPVDASDVTPPLDTPPADVMTPECQDIRCGYKVESCNTDACDIECPQRGQCTGLCGANCTGDCEEDSQCSLVTGSNARIRCEARASCLLTLGDKGEGRCEIGSRCNIVCLGTCALLCDNGATCAFACSSNAPLQSFSGHRSCP
jgi:hypothetical protein